MKPDKIILPTVCILLATLLFAIIPTEADAAIYQDTVRLHILAPSDSVDDQALKLKIRDKILEKYGSMLSHAENTDEARAKIQACITNIENDCTEWVHAEGYSYSVKAEFTEEWYNTREYADFALPSGNYSSLRIIIGEGEGQNWWCVMYPPLCLDIATEKTSQSYTKEESLLISDSGYRVKFKLLEIAASVFGGRK